MSMGTKEYMEFHEEICNAARELSRNKNNDYADPESRGQDPMRVFGNFMQVQHLNVCQVETGFLVRLSDKFSRLCNLLREGHEHTVKEETVEDTIQDIINYVILLAAYRKAVSDEAAFLEGCLPPKQDALGEMEYR